MAYAKYEKINQIILMRHFLNLEEEVNYKNVWITNLSPSFISLYLLHNYFFLFDIIIPASTFNKNL